MENQKKKKIPKHILKKKQKRTINLNQRYKKEQKSRERERERESTHSFVGEKTWTE